MDNQEQQWLLKEKYQGQKTEGYMADCERLNAGEPLGYVIGWVPFLHCKIWLDSHPLIPRVETEFWVAHAIKSISQRTDLWESGGPRILDLCAGSGCIGVAVQNTLPHLQLDFVEIDTAHHTTIKRNCTENVGTDQHTIGSDTIRIFGGDLFAAVPQGTTYTYILSNPPYIDPAIDRAEAAVKTYEPHHALYGGHEGIEVLQRIISTAPDYLTTHGELWLEHEPEQSATIADLAAKHHFAITTHTDQYQIERYSRLMLQ